MTGDNITAFFLWSQKKVYEENLWCTVLSLDVSPQHRTRSVRSTLCNIYRHLPAEQSHFKSLLSFFKTKLSKFYGASLVFLFENRFIVFWIKPHQRTPATLSSSKPSINRRSSDAFCMKSFKTFIFFFYLFLIVCWCLETPFLKHTGAYPPLNQLMTHLCR